MGKKRRSARPPKARRDAELILTTSFAHTDAGFADAIVPALHLVGNPKGYRWLAAYVTWLADRSTKFLGPDGDHEHLRDSHPPCNSKLSDENDIVFRMFTEKTRAQLTKAQGLQAKAVKRGNPAVQFSKLLDELAPYVLETPYLDGEARRKWLVDCERLAEKLNRLIDQLKEATAT